MPNTEDQDLESLVVESMNMDDCHRFVILHDCHGAASHRWEMGERLPTHGPLRISPSQISVDPICAFMGQPNSPDVHPCNNQPQHA